MTSYLKRKVGDVLYAIGDPQQRANSTWITIIAVWLFVVFCVYGVIALLLAGWMLLG